MCQRRWRAQTSGSWRREPGELRPERLAGERGPATARGSRRAPRSAVSSSISAFGARVDAVEDRGPERPSSASHGTTHGPIPLTPTAATRPVALRQELAAERDDTPPTRRPRRRARPAGPRHGDRVLAASPRATTAPSGRAQHALARRGADVDAEQELASTGRRRSRRSRRRGAGRRAAAPRRGRPARRGCGSSRSGRGSPRRRRRAARTRAARRTSTRASAARSSRRRTAPTRRGGPASGSGRRAASAART